MLGFRAISGSPDKLIAVPVTLAAVGSILAFGGTVSGKLALQMSASGSILSIGGVGSALAGRFPEMQASGAIVRLTGLAVPTWTQFIAASGNVLTLTGRPELYIVGKPFRVAMIAEPYRVRHDAKRFRVTQISHRYQVKRAR